MLTDFGMELRKIRIERQELLKDMATRVGVSSAYLSAVETGKRRIPPDWVSRISEMYSLDASRTELLRQAADNSALDVTISLDGASPVKRDAVLSFARALDGLSDEDLNRILLSMKKNSKRGKR